MDRWPINPKRIAALVGVLILILVVMDFNARLEELNLLKKQAAVVSTRATQAVQTQLALETQVSLAGSDEVVNQWARTEGHYIQPGDQPVVPVGVPGPTIEAVQTATATPSPATNWQIWWNLFFGE